MDIGKLTRKLSSEVVAQTFVDKENKRVYLKPNLCLSKAKETFYVLKGYQVERVTNLPYTP